MQSDTHLDRPTLSDPPLGATSKGIWEKEEKSSSKSEEFRFADRSHNNASDSDSDLLYSHTRSDSFDPLELGSMASSQGDIRLSYDQAHSRLVNCLLSSTYYLRFLRSKNKRPTGKMRVKLLLFSLSWILLLFITPIWLYGVNSIEVKGIFILFRVVEFLNALRVQCD